MRLEGRILAATLLVSAVLGYLAAPAWAQPVTERTPNLEGTWITSPWNLHFQFNHRFKLFGGDLFDGGKVLNWPTFGLTLGLWRPFTAGVKYASRPEVGKRANEWFPYLKASPVPVGGGRFALSVLGGYDTGIESWDGEVSAEASVGRLRVLGAVRGMTDALGTETEGVALAGGVNLSVNRYVHLAADVADFVVGPDRKAGWSAGLQIGIPFTPHTLSLQVSNTRSTLLQGASFSSDDALNYGFEFTVPFSGFARWGKILKPGDRGGAARPAQPVPEGTVVEIDVRRFEFAGGEIRIRPGTTVRWVNRDPVAHTATGEDGSWGSPLIGPGETYSRRFDAPGRHPYYCVPHPFMKGVIVVQSR